MVDKCLHNILDKNTLSQLFHENTKISENSKEMLNVNKDITFKIHYKEYPRFKKIKLNKNFEDNNKSLIETIINRRSRREFSKKPLSIKELSFLLLYSAGLTDGEYRAYPSAGARYPLEIYPVIFNCKDVKEGVYHYNVKNHELELLAIGDFKEKIVEYTNNQEWVKDASVVFLISSIFDRTKIKYGERGYRYIFLDAGHLAQNFYLVSTAMGLGCCSIGGFMDDKLNNLLDLDGVKESVIYIVVVGKYDKA